MKIKILPLIIMLSKLSLYGVFVQCLFITVLLASEGNAQKSKSISDVYLTVGFEKSQILDVFETIESATPFEFTYYKKDLPQNRLTLEMSERSLAETLYVIADQAGLKFRRVNDNILVDINKRAKKSGGKEILVLEDVNVSGKVVDETGTGLPGATVLLKGTTVGTTTDLDGNFKLTVPEDAVLTISFIGYNSQEIELAGRTQIDVTLQVNAETLEEVVVVGFGTQKRANTTGASSFVKMESIIGDRPIVNAAQSLQGIAAGLQVVSSRGEPGNTGTSINIRGFTSVSGGSPLVLINNVPGSIDDVNPRDIASISVLKDAAASSIYGARAAFGVIIITTKQPDRNQKVKLEYNTTTSLTRANDLPKKATTRQFVQALSDFGERSYFAGQNVEEWLGYLDTYDSDPSQLNLIQDPMTGDTYPIHFDSDGGQYYPLRDSDIIGDFIDHNGYSTIHNFAVSGGGESLAYRVSTGYSFEDGIMVTNKDSFKKYNINALLNADLTPRLTSTSNILLRSSVRSRPNARYADAIQLRMYDPTGFFEDADGLVLPFNSPGNLVRFSEPGTTNDDNLRLFQKLELSILDNLTLTGEYTYEKNGITTETINNGQRYFSTFRFNPTTTADNVFTNSSLAKGQTNRIYNALNLYAKFNHAIENHNFGLLVGFNRENEEREFFSAFRNGLVDPTTPAFELAEGENNDISDSFYDWAVLGYFGRLNYNYNQKYFLEANLRYDGSSLFAAGKRFAWLPSVSVGWNMAEESFLKGSNLVSLLKLRGSYGTIGNQNYTVNNVRQYYPVVPGYESFSSEWINLDSDERYLTFSPAQLVSGNFTWEEVVTSNIGLDLGFFDDRLAASIDLYSRKTLGMLKEALPLPAVLGTSAPLQNEADLETKGWEVELGWTDRKGDFSYGINVNIFDNQSEITKFDVPAANYGDFYEGYKIGQIVGYVTDGYYTVDDFVEGTLDADLSGQSRQLKDGVVGFQTGPLPYPGDVKFKDLDGDGVISTGNSNLEPEIDPVTGEVVPNTGPGDRKVIGNSTRRYQFGINGFVTYKGFDFTFVLSGVGKRDSWRTSDLIFPYPSGFDHIYAHQLDYWTPDNQDAFYPRVYGDARTGNTDSNYGRNRSVQTKYLSDESNLRIQNITLGYTFDNSLLDRLNIAKLRVFVAGNNLHTFDRLPDGLDPDEDLGNLNRRYPIMSSYSMGLNLTF